jgi:Flp pilus assembly pilin Flp
MHRTNTRKKNRGAALVEYVVLMALIGVVLISVVLTVGVNVTDTFARSTETIANPEGTPPGGNPPGFTPPTVSNPPPTIPVFPPVPPTPSGVIYTANANNDLFYNIDTNLSYAQIADVAFDYEEAVSSASAPAAQFDFDNDVTWTGVSYTFGDVQLYNEIELGTTGLTHNVGPLPGWGTSPAGYDSCNYMGSLYNEFAYLLEGYHSNGDKLEVNMVFRAAPCPFEGNDFNISEYREIRHNQAFAYTPFGTYANALVADRIANGEFAPSTGAIDWTEVANWTIEDVSAPGTNPSVVFYGFVLNANGYSLNAGGPGPAYSVCGEGPAVVQFTVTGVHPDGPTMDLTVNITSTTANDECFMPFGP